VIPTLPLDKDDLYAFAGAVQDRFNNPFVNHELMSISLNSTSKWRARDLPSFLEYVEEKKQLPPCLTASFAAYMAFYSNDIQELTDKGLVCKRAAGNTYTINDDRFVLEFYYDHRNDDAKTLTHAVMKDERMWGMDLTSIEGFEEAACAYLEVIRKEGALAAYDLALKKGAANA
jgi:tagaturonate reductase